MMHWGGGFPLVWVAGVDGSSFFNFRYWSGRGRFSISFGCLFGGGV